MQRAADLLPQFRAAVESGSPNAKTLLNELKARLQLTARHCYGGVSVANNTVQVPSRSLAAGYDRVSVPVGRGSFCAVRTGGGAGSCVDSFMQVERFLRTVLPNTLCACIFFYCRRHSRTGSFLQR